MEVKMNKEIRDYQESMFMGLDLRQCVCSVLAILTAIGIYFGMRDITGQEITGWLYPKKLVFQSEDIHYSCMQETISLGEKNQKDGAEIIKEREQKAEAKQRKKRKGRSDAFD